jgi:hypothetical protein
MLGMSADELAAVKDSGNQGKFEAVLKGALWAEWIMRLQSRTQCAAPTPPCCDSLRWEAPPGGWQECCA